MTRADEPVHLDRLQTTLLARGLTRRQSLVGICSLKSMPRYRPLLLGEGDNLQTSGLLLRRRCAHRRDARSYLAPLNHRQHRWRELQT